MKKIGMKNFILSLIGIVSVFYASATIPPTGVSATATPNPVCVGSNLSLTGTATGATTYSWAGPNGFSSSLLSAVVVSVSSVSAGVYTLTATNGSGSTIATTAIVSINPLPNAGNIAGDSTVCEVSNISLSDTTSGGSWSASNGNASVSSGVVSGILAGTDTISYSVSNTCGTLVATKIITVNPLPSAGSISGTLNVCVGSATTLSDIASGGVWSSVSTGIATVSAGVVSGVAAGTSLISYSVTNSCGTAVATTTVTVNPLTVADTIIGFNTVCVGSTIHMADSSMGLWSAANTNASIDSVSGVLTGLAGGTDTIKYSISGICGIAVATKVITINPLANAGSIAGANWVCAGSTTTFSSTGDTAGTWTVTNSNVSISATGIVTGASAGTDSIIYTVVNMCDSNRAYKEITVNPLPVAGIITDTVNHVCQGDTIQMSESASGGIWSEYTGNASVDSGIVRGVLAGVDTIQYKVTNICGSDSTSVVITVNPTPNAGIISDSVNVICIGQSITIGDTVTGGVWSISDTLRAYFSGYIVTGRAAGKDTIRYAYTNMCGTAYAYLPLTVNPNPNAGTIIGLSAFCITGTLTMLDTTGNGPGAWTTVNGRASIDSAGIVTGVSPGMDSIKHTVTTMCGSASSYKEVNVDFVPHVSRLIGDSIVCAGYIISLTDTLAGGYWGQSNTNAYATDGAVVGLTHGVDTISYSYGNLCGTSTTTKVITVNTIPNVDSITGVTVLCKGSTGTFSDVTVGGVWSVKDSNLLISGTGVATGLHAGLDTIVYTVTNMCGPNTAQLILSVNATPAPVIIRSNDTLFTSNLYSSYQWYKDSIALAGATNAYYVLPDTGKYYVSVTDLYGCTGYSPIFGFNGVSVQGISKNNDGIKVFPNPSNSLIFVEANQPVDATISGIDGKLLIEGSKVKSFDLTNLKEGIYLINVFSAVTHERLHTERILKIGK